jgi:hemoglobin
MLDIRSEDDIVLLVNEFYDRVRADELLGPIFNTVIGDNWDHHLPIMYNFWSAILLGSNRYHGNPVAVHFKLDISSEHFAQWLSYFEKTVRDHFAGPTANEAISRAKSIAGIMQIKLGIFQKN